ncbi:MAG TPA: acyl-CoA dehydrogenase C-terminal domain-containing protein [Myxococcales bacterium LLY-WYZ-16_1]|nr:acyl-CoA dehydrogenase C-terminal domain-containing protein [Myxococcales bacterium LLY-WYZ-16_1]
MQTYKAPVEDMRFLLEAMGYDQVASIEKLSSYDLDTVFEMLAQTGTFMRETLLPTNRVGDEQGLKWDSETGAVTTPDGFKEAYRAMVENGYIGISVDEEFGGGGAPTTLASLISEMSCATNKSLMMCPGLTHGLMEAIEEHGNDAQKKYYLPKLASGEWSGTMCLTEPQCGTDLGLISTKAEPEGDHYKLTGTKIWITFGEHDLTDNIIHFVLARLPDAPPGIKGISVFMVPKVLESGERNRIKCIGLEHKMGIHGSPTCVMEMDGAEGYLVGEPHKGMRAMFTMMNRARLAVGLEGVALSEIAYQTALEFAKDRKQSRALDPAKRDPNSSADNILVHPDVRRMLLNIKSTTEAMRALGTFVSIHLDLSLAHPDEEVRQRSDDLVALLTPVVKSYFTEQGFLNVSEAMQVCGGAGYTKDWSIEQYLRDARIAMIYEGTNHIQALDLVGRKLPLHGGRLLQTFQTEVTNVIRSAKDDPDLQPFVDGLKAASKQLTEVTMALGGKAMEDPEEAGAVASSYLNLFALTACAFCWVKQLQHAKGRSDSVATVKFKTARYWFEVVLPEREALARRVQAGKDPIMSVEPEELEIA